jgi:hypothetical protein
MSITTKIKELISYATLGLVPSGIQGLYTSQDTGMMSDELVNILDPYLGMESQGPNYVSMAAIMAGIWKVAEDKEDVPTYRRGLTRTITYWALIAAGTLACDMANKFTGSAESIDLLATMHSHTVAVIEDISVGSLPPPVIALPYGAALLSTLNSVKNLFIAGFEKGDRNQ